MSFLFDFDAITLAGYRQKLQTKRLIPSQQRLLDDLDEHFASFATAGIDTAGELLALIDTADRRQALAQQTGVNEEYLTVLRREMRGRQTKSRKLADFSWIAEPTVEHLGSDDITTTKQLYEFVRCHSDRAALAERLAIEPAALLELTKQTDLTRIQWVNATFARVLYESGYRTPADVCRADAFEMYEKMRAVNNARQLYRGNIGLNDVYIVVEAAQQIDLDIVY